MASVKVEILGINEMNRILNTLPTQLSFSIQMKALAGAGRKLISVIKPKIPVISGNIFKSLGIIKGTNKQEASVLVAIRIGRKFAFSGKRGGGWYAWFVHEGTKGFGKRTQRATDRKQSGLIYSKSGARGSAGLKPNPFFREGVDEGLPAVKNFIAESYSKEITRFFERNAPKFK